MRHTEYQKLELPSQIDLGQKLALMWDWDSAFQAASRDLETALGTIEQSIDLSAESSTVSIPHCPHHYVDLVVPGGEFDLIAARIDDRQACFHIERLDNGLSGTALSTTGDNELGNYLVFFRREIPVEYLSRELLTVYCKTKSENKGGPAALEFWFELHTGRDKHRMSEHGIEILPASDSTFWTRRGIAIRDALRPRATEPGARAFVFVRLIDLSDRAQIGSIAIV